MDQRGKGLESLYLPLVALTLHGFDSDDSLSFSGVASEDLSEGALAKNAIGVQVKIIGEFDPREKFAGVNFAHTF